MFLEENVEQDAPQDQLPTFSSDLPAPSKE